MFGTTTLASTALVLAAGQAGQLRLRDEPPQAFINQQRTIQDEIRREREAELGLAAGSYFDWGGWFSTYVFLFDDGVESSRTLRRYDLRLWGRAVIDSGAHEVYARGRLSGVDFNSGDSYDGDDNDIEGPNLERGYYRFNLARALESDRGKNLPFNLVGTIGRDLVQFGTGLTLAAPLDHVAMETTVGRFRITGLAGKTVGSFPEFDESRTADRTRRNFIGAEARYLGLDRHEPFAYALWQRDQNEDNRSRPFRSLKYDSQYFGLGSTGELARRLRYQTEWVLETGESQSEPRGGAPADIRAWAFVNELEYLFPGPNRARASVEYLFGSGDPDRTFSPTGTLGNSRGNHEDTGFNAFGFTDTGLAFAPLYSNLHMWRAGASFYPWPEHPRLKGLELGTDWYLFYKHHRAGAVSDPTADEASGYLGWEMDYYANWQVTSDVAWTTRLGVFFPGDAFSDRTTRTFLLVGLTWSF